MHQRTRAGPLGGQAARLADRRLFQVSPYVNDTGSPQRHGFKQDGSVSHHGPRSGQSCTVPPITPHRECARGTSSGVMVLIMRCDSALLPWMLPPPTHGAMALAQQCRKHRKPMPRALRIRHASIKQSKPFLGISLPTARITGYDQRQKRKRDSPAASRYGPRWAFVRKTRRRYSALNWLTVTTPAESAIFARNSCGLSLIANMSRA